MTAHHLELFLLRGFLVASGRTSGEAESTAWIALLLTQEKRKHLATS